MIEKSFENHFIDDEIIENAMKNIPIISIDLGKTFHKLENNKINFNNTIDFDKNGIGYIHFRNEKFQPIARLYSELF